jgi:hypothetical protein
MMKPTEVNALHTTKLFLPCFISQLLGKALVILAQLFPNPTLVAKFAKILPSLAISGFSALKTQFMSCATSELFCNYLAAKLLAKVLITTSLFVTKF